MTAVTGPDVYESLNSNAAFRLACCFAALMMIPDDDILTTAQAPLADQAASSV